MHQRELSNTKGLKSIFPTSFSLSLPFCKSSIKRNVFFFGFVSGLTRPALYPFPATQYAYPMLSPEMTAASWHTPSMYSAASGFRGPYPTSLPINTSLSRYSFVLYVQVFFSWKSWHVHDNELYLFHYRFSPTSLLPSVHPHHVLNSHHHLSLGSKQSESSHETNNKFQRWVKNYNYGALIRETIENYDNCTENAEWMRKVVCLLSVTTKKIFWSRKIVKVTH